MTLLKLERWLFYILLRREVKRMSILQLNSWLTWFELDKWLKASGYEEW